MNELRLRTRAHPDTLRQQIGKHVTDGDYDLLLTGAAKVLKPDGRPLAIYLPGALRPTLDANPQLYEILHSLRNKHKSENRGLASATRRIRPADGKRSYTRPIPSALIGAVDPTSIQRYCRLTLWTGKHVPEYEQLSILLKEMGDAFATHVPDRYAVQRSYVDRTKPEWVIPGTPFTTITVNNTYSTGVHQDAGDLAAGFSCLAVLRKGTYSGGRLCFPEWRTAVDMQHGDLLLMDAHDWHGNTRLVCAHGIYELQARDCPECQAERISVVAYYRERMTVCGTAADEQAKALADAERKTLALNARPLASYTWNPQRREDSDGDPSTVSPPRDEAQAH